MIETLKIFVLTVLIATPQEGYRIQWKTFYQKSACEHARDFLVGQVKLEKGMGLVALCVQDEIPQEEKIEPRMWEYEDEEKRIKGINLDAGGEE